MAASQFGPYNNGYVFPGENLGQSGDEFNFRSGGTTARVAGPSIHGGWGSGVPTQDYIRSMPYEEAAKIFESLYGDKDALAKWQAAHGYAPGSMFGPEQATQFQNTTLPAQATQQQASDLGARLRSDKTALASASRDYAGAKDVSHLAKPILAGGQLIGNLWQSQADTEFAKRQMASQLADEAAANENAIGTAEMAGEASARNAAASRSLRDAQAFEQAAQAWRKNNLWAGGY